MITSFHLKMKPILIQQKRKQRIYIYILCFILFYDFSVFQFIVIVYEQNHWQKNDNKKKVVVALGIFFMVVTKKLKLYKI